MTDPLYDVIEACLQEYKQSINQDAAEEDWQLVDVLLVGSITTDEFVPGESDLDICVILSIPEDSQWTRGVVFGFDAYLMEDCESRVLKAIDVNPTSLDAGVYTDDEFTSHVDDAEVYSTHSEQPLTPTELETRYDS